MVIGGAILEPFKPALPPSIAVHAATKMDINSIIAEVNKHPGIQMTW